jgi:uncharacterized membrane protein
MIRYILFFIVFGFLGWCIDSLYCSFIEKKWVSKTHTKLFSFTYAIGGLILILLFENLKIHFILQLLIATILLVLVELFSGIFSVKVIKKRYWNYSKNKWNYKGHIDALHTFYWLLLAIVFRVVMYLV